MPVYFIQAGACAGPVKIGVADDVGSRLRDLQCANHEHLALLRSIEGAHGEERWLHVRFSHLRIRGEWFSFCRTMLEVTPPPFALRDAALSKIIEAAGGVAALAKGIGIKPQAISQWRRIPAERVADVAAATGIAPAELRPDLAEMFAPTKPKRGAKPTPVPAQATA